MVGVPGRSTGCNTCRKRRVKCDSAKPICERCTRGGFVCGGYERERIWKNTTAQLPKGDGPTPTSSSLRPISRANAVVSPGPSRGLNMIAFQDTFYTSFMFANQVWRSLGAVWLEEAASGYLGPLNHKAALALSQVSFGHYFSQPTICDRGSELYGQCLIGVAGELATAKHPRPDLLLPILIMLMHTGSESDLAGAHSHRKGLTRLIKLCRPNVFQQQPYLDALEAAKPILLTSSLLGRRRLFLNDDEWRTVFLAQDIAMRTSQNEILDILVAVPDIIQDNADFQSDRAMETLKGQLIRLYKSQRKWQIRSSNGKPPIKEVWNKIFETSRGHNLFRSFLVASEQVLYDAALMLLLTLVNAIDPAGAPSHISLCAAQAFMTEGALPFPQPETATSPRHSANALCRAFNWVSWKHSCNKEKIVLYLSSIGVAVAVLNQNSVNDAISAMVKASPVTAQVLLDNDQNSNNDSDACQVVIFVPNVPNEDCTRLV